MRKENKFEVMDKIIVYISNNKKIEGIVEKHKNLLMRDIMSKEVITGNISSSAIKKEWDINDEMTIIGIEK